MWCFGIVKCTWFEDRQDRGHGTWDASQGAEGDSYGFLPSLKGCGRQRRSPMTGKRQMSHLKGEKGSRELQAGWPNLSTWKDYKYIFWKP